MNNLSWRSRLGLLATTSLLACGGADATTDPIEVKGPSTRIDAGFTANDTITARIGTPLSVTVTGLDGKPASRAEIAFTASHPDITQLTSRPAAAYFSSTPTVRGDFQLSARTDSAGRIQVWVQLAETAGRIRIRVTTTFGADSVDGVIRSGKTNNFVIANRDTALYVSGSFSPVVASRDRAGNATVDPVTLTSARTAVAEVVEGRITARSIGRAYIVVAAAAARDSIGLSVVPPGTLIASGFLASSGSVPALFMFGLDGSGYRALDVRPGGYNHIGPRWSEVLQSVVFHEPFQGTAGRWPLGIIKWGVPGSRQSFAQPGGLLTASFPVVSPDGAWIYFSGGTAYLTTSLWRMRPDGTGLARVGPSVSGENRMQATLSPDGRRLVYGASISDWGGTGDMRLMLFDIATGTSLSLAATGNHPAWSPVSEEIAYFGIGGLRVVRADATGDAVITNARFDSTDGQIAWSPDGKWLAGCTTGSVSGSRFVQIVERATGLALPLPFTAKDNLCEATWRSTPQTP